MDWCFWSVSDVASLHDAAWRRLLDTLLRYAIHGGCTWSSYWNVYCNSRNTSVCADDNVNVAGLEFSVEAYQI